MENPETRCFSTAVSVSVSTLLLIPSPVKVPPVLCSTDTLCCFPMASLIMSPASPDNFSATERNWSRSESQRGYCGSSSVPEDDIVKVCREI